MCRTLCLVGHLAEFWLVDVTLLAKRDPRGTSTLARPGR